MVNDVLEKLLRDNSVTNDFREEIKNGFRLPLQDTLNKAFDAKPNYRYGGSLAKSTANKNSCDIDLLCYLDSDVNISVKNIYQKIVGVLEKSEYYYKTKNSAICITGDKSDPKWDISADIVPGKYSSNDKKDVYLWCNKEDHILKSNPDIQIKKIQECSSKDVIRIIKLYRDNNNFAFKSFFLEIFAVDIVEPTYEQHDSLYDKIIKFCANYAEIGKKKIYDSANSNNDIMSIHSSNEFEAIRKKIKELYEALLTNDESTIEKCIKGLPYNIDIAYARDAKSHSSSLNLAIKESIISISCKDNNGNIIISSQPITKKMSINFYITVPNSIPVKSVNLIVSNSGYEALKCKRGKEEPTTKINGKYYRDEETSYNGNHYVQAIVRTTSGNVYYSIPFIVKIRDFD